MTQDMDIPAGPARVEWLAPVRSGRVPTLSPCTYGERLARVFEVLAAGWSGYRDHPWAGSYARRLDEVPGLRSLRWGLVEEPPAVMFEAAFDAGAGAAPLDALRTRLAPLLDLVFANCDAYPGAASCGAFADWVQGAQAGRPAGAMAAATAELGFPAATDAAAPAPAEDLGLALHALADLQRLAPLFANQSDAVALHAAAAFLLPSLPARLAVAGAGDGALRDHFADAVVWLQAGAGAASVVPPPATVMFAAVPPAAGPREIPVEGKQAVMQVLLDPDHNCSVSGYAQRMNASMGLIYLGLDQSDPQYAIQSEASNRAIGTITEDEAFTRALAATREVLQPLAGSAHVDLNHVTDKVLAALCTYWFDIPDGKHVVSSGLPFPLPLFPAFCPGHFAPVSGSIFQPRPETFVAVLGYLDGHLLHRAALKFVAAQRASGAAPSGVLARALFAAFPQSPAQDDLLARTLIGVMMGFLPTAQGNLASVFTAWQGDRMGSLSQALLARPDLDLLQRARDIVRGPMIAAIQAKPVPPAVWRTATRDHVLDGEQVKQGAILSINIESAMQEDLKSGVSDVTPVFGGDRDLDPHPTHACPGLWMGMGVMLGVVTGVLEATPSLPSLTAQAA